LDLAGRKSIDAVVLVGPDDGTGPDIPRSAPGPAEPLAGSLQGFTAPQLVLDAPALGNVAGNADRPGQPSTAIRIRCLDGLDPCPRTIRLGMRLFDALPLARSHGPGIVGQGSQRPIMRIEIVVGLADQPGGVRHAQ